MKKDTTRKIKVTICDTCKKETDWNFKCLTCGADFCYDCKNEHAVEYSHSVYCSGSGDGLYCKACDARLSQSRASKKHNAYSAIAALKLENKKFYEGFRKRSEEAEETLKRLTT